METEDQLGTPAVLQARMVVLDIGREMAGKIKGMGENIFGDGIKALPKKTVDSIDSGTTLSRLMTPIPLLIRAIILVELLNFSVPHFSLL